MSSISRFLFDTLGNWSKVMIPRTLKGLSRVDWFGWPKCCFHRLHHSFPHIHSTAFYLILKKSFHSLIGKKLTLLDCLSLIHTFVESLPHAVIQAGALVVKTVINNDRQCFYPKETLLRWFQQAHGRGLRSKCSVNDQHQPSLAHWCIYHNNVILESLHDRQKERSRWNNHRLYSLVKNIVIVSLRFEILEWYSIIPQPGPLTAAVGPLKNQCVGPPPLQSEIFFCFVRAVSTYAECW